MSSHRSNDIIMYLIDSPEESVCAWKIAQACYMNAATNCVNEAWFATDLQMLIEKRWIFVARQSEFRINNLFDFISLNKLTLRNNLHKLF
jgi:hypothetical protein